MKSWIPIVGTAVLVAVIGFVVFGLFGGSDPVVVSERAGAAETVGAAADVDSGDRSSGADNPRTDSTVSIGPSDDEDIGEGQIDPDAVVLPDGLGELGADAYFNDFSKPLGPEWLVYNSIGHAGWGLRRPSAVTTTADPTAAGGTVLTITAKMGEGSEAGLLVSGGLKLRRPQTYGTYTVRMRVEPDPDEVTSGVALLWPQSNQWPRDGEIDFVETWASRATRTPVESNLHWLKPDAVEPYVRADDAKVLRTHPGVDGTDWHIYRLDWRADLITVTVDDRPPVVLSNNPDEIADWNMEPTLQLDAFPAPHTLELQPRIEGNSVNMFVDYILVEP